MARSAWLETKMAGAVLLALAAGCTAAPLEGKACPCDDAGGYTCCPTTMTCVADAGQCPPPQCTPTFLSNWTITQDGGPHPQPDGGADGGADAVQFGPPGEQWVSYTYSSGATGDWATLALTPDRNGFHVVASVTTAYAGVGLSFLSDSECIDGTALKGVQFGFEGDSGGHVIKFSVMADDDVSNQFDMRGLCSGTTTCYGPTQKVDPTMNPNMIGFDALTSGMPDPHLNPKRIIKVQWEVEPTSKPPDADFTISNVTFY